MGISLVFVIKLIELSCLLFLFATDDELFVSLVIASTMLVFWYIFTS